MKLIRINSSDEMYPMAMRLYRRSFPYCEQREPMHQKKLMEHTDYHFELIYDDDEWVGLIALWQTDEFTYIEHFCILPEKRNHRYGEKTLALLCESTEEKKIILEIDPPVDDISVRRRGFYERCGYKVNGFSHIQPTYHRDGENVPLVIMSYPEKLTQKEYDDFYDYMLTTIFEIK